MKRLLLPAFFLTTLTASSVAFAQPGAPGPEPAPELGVVQRSGFLIGFSLGGGSFALQDCDECETLSGLGLDIHLGGMITPRLALMFDGSGVAHSLEDGGSVVHVIDTIAAQYWVTPRVWVKGGVGVGQLSVNDDTGARVAESETGTGVLLAGGVELLQTESFALDLQLRGSAVTYDEANTISMGSINLGFNWY